MSENIIKANKSPTDNEKQSGGVKWSQGGKEANSDRHRA